MTDVAIIDNKPEGLLIRNDTTFDQWWGFRKRLYTYKQAKEKLDVCMALHTMDWVFWGEDRFGENASQALAFAEEEMGWTGRTASEYRRVWERFPPDRRYDGLGITFYQAVMALPPRTASDLLDMASRNNWTREQLRKAVKHNAPEDKPEPKVTRKDIERACIALLRNLKPAGTYYKVEGEPAMELALLLDHPLPPLVVEPVTIEGQLDMGEGEECP